MREVYFPYGMSTFGDANIMTFKVGNFKEEEVEERGKGPFRTSY